MMPKFQTTCNIDVASGTLTKGNTVLSYTTTSGIPCNYVLDSETESQNYGRTVGLNAYKFMVPQGTVVKLTDIIKTSTFSGDIVSIQDVQGINGRIDFILVKAIEIK